MKREIKTATVSVSWTDQFGHTLKDFSSLQALKEWLDKNPDIALIIGYKKK